MQVHGKNTAIALKKAGKGLFKPVTISPELAKIVGITGETTRPAVVKALWTYIKKNVPRLTFLTPLNTQVFGTETDSRSTRNEDRRVRVA